MSASSERTHFWQHIPIFTSSGGLVKATFLGHLQPEHAVVQWECLGVLAAVFDGSKSPLDVHQSMRTYKPALDTLCLRCSIGEGRVAHFPSVKAVLAAQAAGQTSQSSELARESWCLSSEGVVLLLSYIASASKRAQFKEQAVATLAVWLGLVGSLDELHDAAEAAIEECIPLCEHGRSEGGGACMHLRPAIAKAMESDQTGPTPQVSLAELLQMLAKQSMSCLSCARFLGFFATTLNLQIIRQWGELGASTEALKLERRPNLAGRRRRHSEVFKKELCSGMLKRLRASSSAAEARVQGVDGRRVREWTHEELHSHLVCAQRVLGQHSGTFAHSEDAARIGKPAVEIKTYNLYVPALGVGIWMCNQALGGGHSNICPHSDDNCRLRFPPFRPPSFNSVSPDTFCNSGFATEMVGMRFRYAHSDGSRTSRTGPPNKIRGTAGLAGHATQRRTTHRGVCAALALEGARLLHPEREGCKSPCVDRIPVGECA